MGYGLILKDYTDVVNKSIDIHESDIQEQLCILKPIYASDISPSISRWMDVVCSYKLSDLRGHSY